MRQSGEDGSNVGQWLAQLFEVLNRPEGERQTTLDEDLAAFPYINGDLFDETIRTAGYDSEMRSIADLGGSGGTLDFVTAWFLKAGKYVQQGGNARIGFVATNSITQGEQVAQFWPLVFQRYQLEIAYAHRTFAWGSDARGRAHVHVVIIGLAGRFIPPRRFVSNVGDPAHLAIFKMYISRILSSSTSSRKMANREKFTASSSSIASFLHLKTRARSGEHPRKLETKQVMKGSSIAYTTSRLLNLVIHPNPYIEILKRG